MIKKTKTLFNELLAFAETKDPNERYIYSDNTGCALAQFFAAKHGKPVIVFPDKYRVEGKMPRDIPIELDYVSWAPTGAFDTKFPLDPIKLEKSKYTWGALKHRIKQVLSGEVILPRREM